MTERKILECMRDLADTKYQETTDKWWLQLGLILTRRIQSGRKFEKITRK